MRIGINALFLVPGDVGGTEIYFRNNLKEMTSSHPDHIFVLFTTEDNELVLRQDLDSFSNVEYFSLGFKAANRPLRIILEQILLPFAVWRAKIDILWSPGYTAPFLCICPQVVTIHDLQYKTHPDDMSSLERITLDILVRGACKRCESIIAVSEFSRQEIVRYNFASPDRVFAVLEGVDKSFSASCDDSGTTDDFYSDLGLENDTPYILCIAHSYPHKNLHILIDAFCLLMEIIPHHLILIGKARRGEDIVSTSIKSLPVVGRFHRYSDISFGQLKKFYRNADLFVLPSSYEGFGLPVLEAMMSSTAVIISRKASLPEVGGEYAFYLESVTLEAMQAKILEVIHMDKDLLARRIIAAQQWAADFTWTKSASETMKILLAAAR